MNSKGGQFILFLFSKTLTFTECKNFDIEQMFCKTTTYTFTSTTNNEMILKLIQFPSRGALEFLRNSKSPKNWYFCLKLLSNLGSTQTMYRAVE